MGAVAGRARPRRLVGRDVSVMGGLERTAGIETASPDWKAGAQPIYHVSKTGLNRWVDP